MKIFIRATGPLQCNTYLLISEGGDAAVIDPGGDAPRLLALLEAQGAALRQILLTHGHYDHMGAAEALMQATGAPLKMHPDDAPMLQDAMCNLSTPFTGEPLRLPPAYTPLGDGEEIAVGGDTLRVLHTPGHSPGSVCFLNEKDRVLFSGDTLFCRSIGRTDFPGGDPTLLLRSLRRLAALEGDYRVLPGHEEETTLEAERRQNPYMQADPFGYFD